MSVRAVTSSEVERREQIGDKTKLASMKIDKEIKESKEKVFVKLFEVDYSILDWQKSVVLERLESYKKDPGNTSDFDETITKFKVSLMQ